MDRKPGKEDGEEDPEISAVEMETETAVSRI